MVQALSSTINDSCNPDYIDIHHWEEWKKSGVSDAIIKLNVQSVHDSRKVDEILNRNYKNRWKHSDHLVPAWRVAGIDPLTDEFTFEGAQVKPDISPLMNGKPQKYLSPSEYTLAPLFLNPGIPGYWKRVIEDKTIPVIIIEGAKKAGCLLTNHYAVISIPGVSTCRKNGRLHKLLLLLCGFGRTFYICFDNDVVLKKPVQHALLNLSRDIAATGSKVMVIELPEGEHKGADDYITANGKPAFEELVLAAPTIEEWKEHLNELWLLEKEKAKSLIKSKVARNLHLIKQGWGGFLRFNLLKNQVEATDEIFDLDEARLRIALDFDIDVPERDAISIIEKIAKEQSYHPVQEYIERVAEKYPTPDLSVLDNLATKYFGSTERLHNVYMRKTLIAAVARIYEPGCKHDHVTVIVGEQGTGKSTFWERLFGKEFFSDQLGEASKTEDDLMKLHQFWGLEWSEFETVYRRQAIGQIKKFITSTVDTFRVPYARKNKSFPRQSILCGTTNETEIMNDPTGSRRFWIINSTIEEIPTDQLEEERDLLWAAAYHAYSTGEKWSLDRSDRQRQSELNASFEMTDPWLEPVQQYVESRDYVATCDVLNHLQVEIARQDKGLKRRVTDILRSIGWCSVRLYINKGWKRLWAPKKIKVGFSDGSNGSSDGSSDGSRHEMPNDVLQNTQNTHQTLHPVQNTTHAQVDPLDPLDPSKKQTFIFFSETTERSTSSTDELAKCPLTGLDLPRPFDVEKNGMFGLSTAKITATRIHQNRKTGQKIEFQIDYCFADGTTQLETLKFSGKQAELETLGLEKIAGWENKSLLKKENRYRVMQMADDGFVWVEGCMMTAIPTHPTNTFYRFSTPDMRMIQVAGIEEFEYQGVYLALLRDNK